MFNGSLNAPGDYFEPLQAVGAKGSTAPRTPTAPTTSRRCPAHHLPLATLHGERPHGPPARGARPDQARQPARRREATSAASATRTRPTARPSPTSRPPSSPRATRTTTPRSAPTRTSRTPTLEDVKAFFTDLVRPEQRHARGRRRLRHRHRQGAGRRTTSAGSPRAPRSRPCHGRAGRARRRRD